jgi:hypothetical protein
MALTTSIRIVALVVTAGFAAAPAFAASVAPAVQIAQTEEPAEEAHPTEPEQPAQEAFQPNDEQIASFVTATVRIIAIQREAQEEITAAKEPAQQEQVRDEALQMIVAAVESEGLSVDEYNGIVQHVESDPELGETVKQRIQDQITE